MEVFRRKAEMRAYSREQRAEAKRIGLVPTMGALHEGHYSLLRRARQDNDVVVASIFVNPTQFGRGEDFGRYPRTFASDRARCAAAGVDAVFAPTAREMYRAGAETCVVHERLMSRLCGASRPTHFRGVLTVVLKLFNVVEPHVAYFGQKDYQQTAVIRRMVAELDVPVEVVVLPTVREPDGLAMSSRNRYLSAEERREATCLWRALTLCTERFRRGERSARSLCAAMRSVIRAEPHARVDYVEIVRPESLEPVTKARRGDVALVAVYVGKTRLIDNAVLG